MMPMPISMPVMPSTDCNPPATIGLSQASE